ncbi:MAG: alpha/beta hydrolase [Candidatus Peribacteraceae bacterium]|jgi:pimeloyl-ACP methyl ester carboxylesterase
MSEKVTLLCLHGWGGSRASFTELRAALKGTELTILTPDLPGFGKEPEPAHPWTVTDYAEWVERLVKMKEIENPLFLLGHSHGGRIALKVAYRGKVKIKHLYLCAAAGIRHPKHFRRALGLMVAKPGKLLLSLPGLKQLDGLGKKALYKLFRVHDYETASPVMRQTMVNVSKEDLRPLLPFIKMPTDIFWGEKDGMTPVSDARLMHERIKKSTLHLFPDVRHRVHRDKAEEIAEVIRKHLR